MQPNFIQLTEERLQELLQSSATLGAFIAMRNAGVPYKELYSRLELGRMFGIRTINKLIKEGKLKAYRAGNGRPKYKLSDVEMRHV